MSKSTYPLLVIFNTHQYKLVRGKINIHNLVLYTIKNKSNIYCSSSKYKENWLSNYLSLSQLNASQSKRKKTFKNSGYNSVYGCRDGFQFLRFQLQTLLLSFGNFYPRKLFSEKGGCLELYNCTLFFIPPLKYIFNEGQCRRLALKLKLFVD